MIVDLLVSPHPLHIQNQRVIRIYLHDLATFCSKGAGDIPSAAMNSVNATLTSNRLAKGSTLRCHQPAIYCTTKPKNT